MSYAVMRDGFGERLPLEYDRRNWLRAPVWTALYLAIVRYDRKGNIVSASKVRMRLERGL